MAVLTVTLHRALQNHPWSYLLVHHHSKKLSSLKRKSSTPKKILNHVVWKLLLVTKVDLPLVSRKEPEDGVETIIAAIVAAGYVP